MSEKKNKKEKITILGVGNILLTDEGFGVHVIRELERQYAFPKNVSVVDGGVLGLGLLNTILDADRLIVVDAVKNGQPPGALYRIPNEEIPQRVNAKNSLHQIDLIETLTKAKAIGKVPDTVILGVEPEDITSYRIEPTPNISKKIIPMIGMILNELKQLNVSWTFKN